MTLALFKVSQSVLLGLAGLLLQTQTVTQGQCNENFQHDGITHLTFLKLITTTACCFSFKRTKEKQVTL